MDSITEQRLILIVWDKFFGTFQPELPAGLCQPNTSLNKIN